MYQDNKFKGKGLFTSIDKSKDQPLDKDMSVKSDDPVKEESKSASKKSGKRILLAEDEKPLSKVMTLKLTNTGFDVTPAYNGEDALKLALEGDFDLILLDLVMPKLGGFEVLEELKKQGNKTRVLVLSNLSQTEDVQKAKALGAIDFFIKSNVPIASIVEYIKNLLNA
jgi:DNA-binding response OmpR family regulator